jgi:sugar phosphate isomerase/epimerase
MSRREALGALGLLALSGRMAWGTEAAAKAGMALQLYTVRDLAKKDLDGTLKKAAAMGWRYVQWSGMPALPADKIRAALDKAGLKCIACHRRQEAYAHRARKRLGEVERSFRGGQSGRHRVVCL